MKTVNIKVDKMRYQLNKVSYFLILLALAIQVFSLFQIITPSTVKPSLQTAIEILVNIVLLLVTFLAAEKNKIYDKKWGIAVFYIAAIHLARIFYEPMSLFNKAEISFWHFMFIIMQIIMISFLLVFAGIITIKKHNALKAHLQEIGE